MAHVRSNKKEHVFLLTTVILLAVIFVVFYFIFGFIRNASKVPAVVAPDLDEVSKVCGYAIPTEEISFTKGTYYKSEEQNTFTDYYYRARLDSVESKSVNGCDFVALRFIFAPTPASNVIFDPFVVYLPKNMPSLGTESAVMPSDMLQYKGKILELVVRYGKDVENGPILAISGWQLRTIYDL